MVKTLIIKYTPREERSKTKQILDAFIAKAGDVEVLDLCDDVPDLFVRENLSVYMRKNYAGEDLSEEELKPMAKMYRMANQLIEADFVVLAFPMYNYGVPAVVKAWLDSVNLNNMTFSMGPEGLKGLLNTKEALVISTAGATYSADNPDHMTPMVIGNLKFMGIDTVHSVFAQGMNMAKMGVDVDAAVESAKKEVEAIAEAWNKGE